MKKKHIFIIALCFAVLVFGIMFVYHGYNSFVQWQDEQTARETNQIVQDIFQLSVTDIVAETLEPVAIGNNKDSAENGEMYQNYSEYEPPDLSPFYEIIAAFETLREVTGNSDIVGYIYIPGTSVNYVVVQGTDNRFYLNHDIFGNRNTAGAVFLDYLNYPDFTDPNTIIYGHNMNNGTKFYSLRYYVMGAECGSFFDQHPYIIIITEHDVLVYEIFSVFTTNISFSYTKVSFGYGEFEELVNELNYRSMYNTYITATAEDNLLLLSTCVNTLGRDMRIVVAGRLARLLRISQYQFYCEYAVG